MLFRSATCWKASTGVCRNVVGDRRWRDDATRRLGRCQDRCGAARDTDNGAVSSPSPEPLPDDIDALKALIVAHRAALRLAEARAATAENEAKARGLEIEKLRHTIAKLRHERFGQSSERRALLDQLELQLFELEEDEAQAWHLPAQRAALASEGLPALVMTRRDWLARDGAGDEIAAFLQGIGQ